MDMDRTWIDRGMDMYRDMDIVSPSLTPVREIGSTNPN
jgi:hypothetical protein